MVSTRHHHHFIAATTTTRITSFIITIMFLFSHARLVAGYSSSTFQPLSRGKGFKSSCSQLRMMSSSSSISSDNKKKKGKLLVMGGTGFLGQTICKRATLEGYSVTSLSRRGLPPPSSSSSTSSSSTSASSIDYRRGDARNILSVQNILSEGGYVGVVHCIGLLFDDSSGIGNLNYYVSGSGSVPDENSTYDSITRESAFNAIDATMEYVQSLDVPTENFPLVFISAAEAGWPDMRGGAQVERFLAPGWLKRYLIAKRAVEDRLLSDECSPTLRPIIPRPSLIYSLDRPASYVPVGAFFVGNRIGLPFVDRPVTVQSLANAVVRSISRESVRGVQRYKQIDELNK